MSIGDLVVYRIYRCETCEAEIECEQKAKENFKSKCPFCEKRTLVLKSARTSMVVLIDTKTPKTLGSLADKNTANMKKDGTLLEDQKEDTTPWWRKGKRKIDYKILRNPNKYIQTGHA